MRSILLLLLYIFPCLLSAQRTELQLPIPASYVIPKATGPLVIDGKDDDMDWSGAAYTTLFTDIEGDIKPSPYYNTRVKMLWDDEFLYFFAEMEEEHIWGDITERDAVIFYNNDFEIFIKPNDRLPVYAEFEVNALGTLWDLLLMRPYRRNGPVFDEWDVNDTRIGIHIRGTLNDPSDIDQGWDVEMAIPLDALSAIDRGRTVQQGATWRINFSRVQWQHDIIDGIYSKKNDADGNRLPEHNWVWTPQWAIDMHRPEHWGYLHFAESADDDTESDPLATEYQYLFHLYRLKLGNSTLPETDGAVVNGSLLRYTITETDLGFEITVTNRRGDRLTLNQDGYLNSQ